MSHWHFQTPVTKTKMRRPGIQEPWRPVGIFWCQFQTDVDDLETLFHELASLVAKVEASFYFAMLMVLLISPSVGNIRRRMNKRLCDHFKRYLHKNYSKKALKHYLSRVDLVVGTDAPSAIAPLKVRKGCEEDSYAVGCAINGPLINVSRYIPCIWMRPLL